MRICVVGVGKELEQYMNGNFKKYISMIIDEKQVGKRYYNFTIQGIEDLKKANENAIVAISNEYNFKEMREKIQLINSELNCMELKNAIKEMPKVGYCNICKKDVAFWGYVGQDNKTVYKIIGNGKRLSGCCHCGAIDRERWIYYVMENYTDIFYEKNEKYQVLHFAPEKQIGSRLRRIYKKGYYSADIRGERVDYIVDMQNMQFADKKFKYIIANHVLEHVIDDKKAIEELARCLRDDGIVILSFPICMEINTLENENYNKEFLRKKYYGQEDHVRLYGRDFIKRFEDAGFMSKIFMPCDILKPNTIKDLKIIGNDRIIILKKKNEGAESL